MKKGFTMIELIFVIVILGILASVAIPRLAATRTDAEVAAAVANLRTLLNDVASYYAVKGEFGTTVKWKDITNVTLQLSRNNPITASTPATQHGAHLAADGKNCISVKLVDRSGNIPAYILFVKDRENKNQGLCKEILEAEPVRAFLASTVDGLNLSQLGPTTEDGTRTAADGAIAIGSSTTIY